MSPVCNLTAVWPYSNTPTGVTVVQYREKHKDTGAMIETAERLHALTRAHDVPLIINDRIDVALAVGAEGIHIGQDDMSTAPRH